MTTTEKDIIHLNNEILIIDRDIKRYENKLLTTTPEDCKKYERRIKKLKRLKEKNNDCLETLKMIYKKTEFDLF